MKSTSIKTSKPVPKSRPKKAPSKLSSSKISGSASASAAKSGKKVGGSAQVAKDKVSISSQAYRQETKPNVNLGWALPSPETDKATENTMKTEANQEPPNRSLKFKNGANIRVANLDGDVKHAQSGTPTFRTKDGSSHQVSSKGGFLGRETKIRREDKDGKTSTDTFTRKFGYERDEKNDAEGNKTIRESSLFGLVSSTKKFSENGDVKVKQSKFLGLDTTQLEDAIPDPIHHLQETRNRIGRSLNKLNPVNILLSPFGGNV